CQHGYGPPYSF
nr:immunoglobulin light chain junction region [Macaca mulatta]